MIEDCYWFSLQHSGVVSFVEGLTDIPNIIIILILLHTHTHITMADAVPLLIDADVRTLKQTKPIIEAAKSG